MSNEDINTKVSRAFQEREILLGMVNKLLQEIQDPWAFFEGPEGYIPGCHFCGCGEFEADSEGNITYGHDTQCAWVMAMTMLNYPIAPHAVYLGVITDEE